MQIFVKYENKSLTIDVELSDTIESVKQTIEDKLGITLKYPHYKLRYNSYYGKDLDYSKTIADYCIIKESTIFVIFNPFTSSFIDIKFKNQIISMKFDCFCCYSILDYKKEIEKKRGYPIDIQFLYSDKEGTNILADDDYESNPVFLEINDKELKKGYKVKYFDGVKEYDIISGDETENIKEIKKK